MRLQEPPLRMTILRSYEVRDEAKARSVASLLGFAMS
jgi:hypothetical protein